MKQFLLCLCIIGFISAEAQVTTPAPSPAGSVSTVVGLTDIKIDYSRPHARGRKIFGSDASALIPYGSIWRTGANNGTKISFSDDVKVEGTSVPKGEYLIFSWPGEKEWTISLYKDLTIGGATNRYDKAKEAARFNVKSSRLAEKVEILTFNIADISDDSKTAAIQLQWENTSVKFTVTVDYDSKVMKSIEANTKLNPGSLYAAAVYYLETGRDLKQALEWINVAADANPNAYWILHQKAKIHKGLGDKEGAKKAATASLEAAKKAENRDYVKMNEELIASLK